jgi:hypothetical protein
VSDQYLSKRNLRVEELGSRLEAISKAQFEESFRLRRAELKAVFRDPETRRRIGELKKERREGKIDEGEQARRMDEILRGPRPGAEQRGTG